MTTNYLTQSQYWPNGMISSLTRGNNVGLTQDIDNRQRPTCAIETNNSVGWELWTGCLGYNPNSTITWSVYNNGGWGYAQFLSFMQDYTYDNLNRLTSVVDTTNSGNTQNYTRNYSYDQWGNMWVPSRSGGPWAGNTPVANVYNSATNRDLRGSYDGAGNLLSVDGNTASYDAENRMKALSATAEKSLLRRLPYFRL